MNTRKLTLSALLLASDVLLTRVLAFNTPLMKIGLGFAAVAICARLYGAPWAALVAAALASPSALSMLACFSASASTAGGSIGPVPSSPPCSTAC